MARTALALLLPLTGCFFFGRGAATMPSVPHESQAEIAAGYSAERRIYKNCVDVEVDGNLGDPLTIPTTLAIQPDTITSYDDRDGHETAIPLGDTGGWSDKVFVVHRNDNGDHRLLYLVGDFIYGAELTWNSRLSLGYICHRNDDAGAIRAMNGKAHLDYLTAYREVRSKPGAEAYSAQEAAARKRQAEKEAAASAPQPLTDEQLAQIERARTMIALSIEASTRNADAPLTLWVTLALADGSTMRIGVGDRIFDEILAYSTFRSDIGMLLEVRSKDTPELRVSEEVYYTLDTEQSLVCRGLPGFTGVDPDPAGGMYYVGQPGQAGPSITVDITTTGRTNPAGEQILRYRLRCDDQERIFDASASSLVKVETYGGKGGHGVPRPNYDGTDGGAGGDGGDITITADPSVTRYNVQASSHGGPGGNASYHKETLYDRVGRKGSPGEDGRIRERRASVEIP